MDDIGSVPSLADVLLGDDPAPSVRDPLDYVCRSHKCPPRGEVQPHR